jgi:hypothetical protein
VAIVLVAENLGHIKAIGAMTGRSLDSYLGRAFLGDGLATIVSASGGGTGVNLRREHRGRGGDQGLPDGAFRDCRHRRHPARLLAQGRRLDSVDPASEGSQPEGWFGGRLLSRFCLRDWVLLKPPKNETFSCWTAAAVRQGALPSAFIPLFAASRTLSPPHTVDKGHVLLEPSAPTLGRRQFKTSLLHSGGAGCRCRRE